MGFRQHLVLPREIVRQRSGDGEGRGWKAQRGQIGHILGGKFNHYRKQPERKGEPIKGSLAAPEENVI